MKTKVLSLALLLAACSLNGQVSVELTFDQEQYLAGEKVTAAVRVTNRSGQNLKLGDDPDWLTFSMENADGLVLPKYGEPPVMGEFELESSKRATKRVDLSPWFPLTVPSRYTVTALVKFKEWGLEKSSAPKGFNIISGAKLWEQEVGVPSQSNGAVPEVRRYILQQANFIKANLRLYLRVTDVTGEKIYRVVPIGPLLSFSRPEAQVDQASNLHVLYLAGPQTFSYTSYDPDGALIQRQAYTFSETRPKLRMKEGKISVAGGARRESHDDFPASEKKIEPEDTKEQTFTTTNGLPAQARSADR